LDGAIERFTQEGFTDAQMNTLATNPNLETLRVLSEENGSTLSSKSPSLGPSLEHLQITRRFRTGYRSGTVPGNAELPLTKTHRQERNEQGFDKASNDRKLG
jgi:hypothetical protein